MCFLVFVRFFSYLFGFKNDTQVFFRWWWWQLKDKKMSISQAINQSAIDYLKRFIFSSLLVSWLCSSQSMRYYFSSGVRGGGVQNRWSVGRREIFISINMVSDVISFNKSINRRRFVELTLTQYTLQYTFYSLQALNV